MVSSWRAGLVVRPIVVGELERFNTELGAHHWLGHRLTGRVLRYVATVDGEWVAVAGFGSAALACAAREGFLGWDRELRLRRLGLITGNQRLCVLPAGRRPNLASAVLGGCLRRLPADHLAVWGHPVLAVETFTDPSRHAGSCYAAAGFTSVGPSAGYARNRGTKIRHGQPKVYWLRPLHRHGLTTLCAAFDSPLITDRQGRAAVDLNTLDIDGPGGLLAALGQVPEHRKARGIRHDLAAVLAVATAAVLCGADSTTAIAQHARTLTQPALTTLGIRRNKRTHTYVAPSYQTLRRAIRSVDAHALDTAVCGWLHTQVSAGRLSTGQLTALVIALDGKTVRGAKDANGNQLHLFAALVHDEATVIAQHPVDSKTNEITGFTPLLDQIAEQHHPEPDQPTTSTDTDTDTSDDSDTTTGSTGGNTPEPRPGNGKLHNVIVTADAGVMPRCCPGTQLAVVSSGSEVGAALADYYCEEFEEILEMSDFQEDPRTLDEILEAEKEFFDRCWYEYSSSVTERYDKGDRKSTTQAQYQVSVDAQARAKARRPDLRPAESNYEWGMWNGKLSTLRWVLGSEWDFLDT